MRNQRSGACQFGQPKPPCRVWQRLSIGQAAWVVRSSGGMLAKSGVFKGRSDMIKE